MNQFLVNSIAPKIFVLDTENYLFPWIIRNNAKWYLSYYTTYFLLSIRRQGIKSQQDQRSVVYSLEHALIKKKKHIIFRNKCPTYNPPHIAFINYRTRAPVIYMPQDARVRIRRRERDLVRKRRRRASVQLRFRAPVGALVDVIRPRPSTRVRVCVVTCDTRRCVCEL